MATALKNLKFSDQVVLPADLDGIGGGAAESLGSSVGQHLFWSGSGFLAYAAGAGGEETIFADPNLYDATGQGGCASDQYFLMERAAAGLLWFDDRLWSLSCPSLGGSAEIGDSGTLTVTIVG